MTDKEQIIKGLECISGKFVQCKECAYFAERRLFPECRELAGKDALALINSQEQKINELTDEKDWYKRYYFNHEYDKMEAEVRADTVRKMQDSIAVHFGTYTTEDYVRVLDVIRVIYSLGEELLSEGEEVKDDTVDRR